MNEKTHLERISPEFEEAIKDLPNGDRRTLRKIYWSLPPEERLRRQLELDIFPVEGTETAGFDFYFEDKSWITTNKNTSDGVIANVANGVLQSLTEVLYCTEMVMVDEDGLPTEGALGEKKLQIIADYLSKELGKEVGIEYFVKDGWCTFAFTGDEITDHPLLSEKQPVKTLDEYFTLWPCDPLQPPEFEGRVLVTPDDNYTGPKSNTALIVGAGIAGLLAVGFGTYALVKHLKGKRELPEYKDRF